jgi:hypothetical protein
MVSILFVFTLVRSREPECWCYAVREILRSLFGVSAQRTMSGQNMAIESANFNPAAKSV